MLLPGLKHYLVESFRVASHSAATSDAIDRDIQQLQDLDEWKKMPLDDRPAGFTDDMIEWAIPVVEAKMTERGRRMQGRWSDSRTFGK